MLLRIEIFLFLLSLGYSLYYAFDILFAKFKAKQQQKKEKIEKRKKLLEKSQQESSQESQEKSTQTQQKFNKNSTQSVDLEWMRETLKRIQVNKARWYYETARSLIIEWLAFDKNNKDFNLELADIYELEENYKKAEYIYKDLLVIYVDNIELLKKLGNTLILQWNLDEAVAVFETAFKKKKDDLEIIDELAELYFELKNYKKCLEYVKMFLREKPKNIEKLWMKGYCLEKQGSNEDAIECYQRILDFQPYNMEIKERIKKLS